MLNAGWLDRALPWRFRSLSNFAKANANALFRCVLATPPIPCVPDADIEVHALVCRRDVNMLLLAAKSFLRFAGQVSLVLHDDGSLLPQDCSVLEEHLPNARMIERTRADAELAQVLPEAMKGLRRRYIFLLKLFDFNHYCRGRKLIALDSDLLFLREPEAVIEWMKPEASTSFYNQDPADTFRAAAKVELTGVPRNLNAGFIGFPAPIRIDEIVSAIQLLDYALEDQTLYAWLFATRRPMPLSPNEYFVFTGGEIPPQARMVHFISTHRFTGMTYVKRARAVCAELAGR